MSDLKAVSFLAELAEDFLAHAKAIIGEHDPIVVRMASWREDGVELDYVVETGCLLAGGQSRDIVLELLARTYRARAGRVLWGEWLMPGIPERYQELLEERYPIFRGSGLEVGPGWFDLLAAVADWRREIDGDFHPFVQTKEKFGGLRLYGMMSGQAQTLCDAAEHLSFYICDVCGRQATSREVRGWIATRCAEHLHA